MLLGLAFSLATMAATRTTVDVALPDLPVIDHHNISHRFPSVANRDGSTLVQFVFTSCTTVCPVMTRTFAALQKRLGPRRVHLITISIDPEFDTPARLKEYARSVGAGQDWLFLTGRQDDIIRIERAFDVYHSNKMAHDPVTFLRSPTGAWTRIDGLVPAAKLAMELATELRAGRRIYTNGEGVAAIAFGGEPLSGLAVACVHCHRPSGYGAIEGGVWVPPITGPVLFHSSPGSRAEYIDAIYLEDQPNQFHSRARIPRTRPAYSGETLAIALRAGKDSSGRVLDPIMPRYDLSDSAVLDLIGYLRTLGANGPGVDESEIHFATVVSASADVQERKAMLDVIEAYFQWKNADVAREILRPGHSPWYKDDFAGARRKWVLHKWILDGPPETWPQQLDRMGQDQPVFALVSGLVPGSWRPIHDFCERTQTPCLFPNTNFPVPDPPGDFSLYFSQGVTLEARALARFLRNHLGAGFRITQTAADSEIGRIAAQAFRNAVREAGGELVDSNAPILVAWLGDPNLIPESRTTVVSGSFMIRAESVNLHGNVLWLQTYAVPQHEDPSIFHAISWLRARRVEPGPESIQLNTYFALNVLNESVTHMAERFSRAYLIECVEHELSGNAGAGVFPALSLGPGQRFASKGAYVVNLRTGQAEWIVP